MTTAIPHDNLYSLAVNPDSSYDTQFENGDKPVAGPLVAVDPVAYAALMGSLQNLPAGVSVSKNVRSVLTGAEKDTAVISLVTVSGNDAAADGWTAPGTASNLTANGTAGVGIFDLIATDSRGTQVAYPQSPWSFVVTSGSDTMAPTIPTGVDSIGISNAIQLTFDSSSDPYDGSTSGSRTDHYNIYDGATLIAPSPIAVANSPLVPKLNFTSISGSSPAASATQNHQAWTFSVAGAGIHKVAADECGFLGATLAGDCFVALEVDTFTSAYQYSTVGLMIRDSLDPSAIMGAIYLQAGAGLGAQVKVRPTTGALSGNVASVSTAVGGSHYGIMRSGNTISYLMSPDGSDWSIVYSATLGLGQSPMIGAFASSQNPGVPISAVVREINLFAGPGNVVTVPSTTTRHLSATAVDKNGNESAKSVVTTASPQQSAGGGAIQFNYGDYISITGGSLTSWLTTIASYKNKPGVKGVQLFIDWADYEGARGDYSAGRAMLAQIDAACAAAGLCWAIVVNERIFGLSNVPNPNNGNGVLPDYLATEPNGAGGWDAWPGGTQWTGGLTFMARLDTKAIMDRLKLVWGDIGSQHNNNQRFTLIATSETAVSVPNWNNSGWLTQLLSLVNDPAVNAALSKVPRRMNGNFLSPSENIDALLQAMKANRGWMGLGPDCQFPAGPGPYTKDITWNEYWIGAQGVTGDCRPFMPDVVEQQELGYNRGETPAQVGAYMNNQMQASFRFWVGYDVLITQGWPGAGGYIRLSDTLAYLATSTGPARKTPPASWLQ